MRINAETSLKMGIEVLLLALTFSCGGGKSSARDSTDYPVDNSTASPDIQEVKVENSVPAGQIPDNSGDASSESTPSSSSSVSSVETESLPLESEFQEMVPFRLLSPSYACFSTSDLTVDIRGSCQSGEKIRLEGSVTAPDFVQPLGQSEIICQDDHFHFILSLADGIHYIEVLSELPNRVVPALTIIVDRTRPAPVQIQSPLLNPVSSGDASLMVQGSCEIGATVKFRGDMGGQANCSSAGQFTFVVDASAPGVYQMTIVQIDGVGLDSDPVELVWIFDDTIPPAPTLIAPTSLSPFTQIPSLEIRGSCLDGYRIRLDGSVPGGSIDQLCSGGQFSFLVQKSQDGTYSIHVYQSNPTNLYDSNPIPLVWTLDSTAPSAVTLTSNSPNFETPGPITLLGNCEALASVVISGSSEAIAPCDSGGHFTLIVDEPMDGDYHYDLFQKDAAGNEGPRTSITWKRNNTLLPSPVLVTPLTREVIGNSNKLILTGTCVINANVSLSSSAENVEVVNPSSAFEQNCVNGTFSFTLMLPLSTSFSTISIAVWQAFGAVSSDAILINWTSDRIAPQVLFTLLPALQNIQNEAIFSFQADDSDSHLECRLDASDWFSCVSPMRLDKLSNGQHSFDVRARDTAGNVSEVISYFWQQIKHQAIALLHFDATAELLDSSSFSEYFKLEMQSVQPQETSQGLFAEGLLFNRSRGDRLLANLTPPFQTLSRAATFEAWINFDSFGSATEQTIISLGTADQICMKFSVIRVGSRQSSHRKMVLTIALSDGTTARINSGNITLVEGGGRFHHLAVTFNMGEVRFSLDGIPKGRGTAGLLGSSLIGNCQGSFSIGGDLAGSNHLSGILDELRLSNIVRYQGTFVPSTQHFAAD